MVQIDKKTITAFLEESGDNFDLFYREPFLYRISQLLLQGIEEEQLFRMITNVCAVKDAYAKELAEMKIYENKPYHPKTDY